MKKMILLIALMTLVALASGVMAQQQPASAKPAGAPTPAPVKVEQFSGMVYKIDEMAKTIVVKGKVKKEEKALTFTTDGNTKIQKAGKGMPFSDLKKEMTVSVEYKKEGEKVIATRITVAGPKVAPKKDAPQEASKK